MEGVTEPRPTHSPGGPNRIDVTLLHGSHRPLVAVAARDRDHRELGEELAGREIAEVLLVKARPYRLRVVVLGHDARQIRGSAPIDHVRHLIRNVEQGR